MDVARRATAQREETTTSGKKHPSNGYNHHQYNALNFHTNGPTQHRQRVYIDDTKKKRDDQTRAHYRNHIHNVYITALHCDMSIRARGTRCFILSVERVSQEEIFCHAENTNQLMKWT